MAGVVAEGKAMSEEDCSRLDITTSVPIYCTACGEIVQRVWSVPMAPGEFSFTCPLCETGFIVKIGFTEKE